MLRAIFLALGLALASSAAQAQTCPNYIYYKNGNYLKSGEYYYHANGNYLKSGSYLYYSNGNYLRSGDYLYYNNGNYLKSGGYLYYPNGNYLKSGDYYYYDNGNYLKSGSYFYYKNGNYARSGSTLYRADGTTTSFPLTLAEPVSTFGTHSWKVASSSEEPDIDLDRIIDDDQLRGHLHWDGTGFDGTFRLKTGYENESVILKVDSAGAVTCSLDGSSQPSRTFTITHAAATVKVEVNDGYDVNAAKAALKAALDGL